MVLMPAATALPPCLLPTVNPPNTIPRECTAVLAVAKGQGAAFEKLVAAEAKIAQGEYKPVDANFNVKVTQGGSGDKAASAAATEKILNFIDMLPHGVQRYGPCCRACPTHLRAASAHPTPVFAMPHVQKQ